MYSTVQYKYTSMYLVCVCMCVCPKVYMCVDPGILKRAKNINLSVTADIVWVRWSVIWYTFTLLPFEIIQLAQKTRLDCFVLPESTVGKMGNFNQV